MPETSRPILVALAGLFVTCLLISNIIAVKLVAIAGTILPAAVIVFPLSYLLGDVLTEIYGYRVTRRIIWLGFGCNLIAVAAIALARILPAPPIWTGQDAFDAILGATPRILGASFLAYLVGEFLNAYVLARLKVATAGRHLWLRTIGSTVIGQGVDSAIFITLAFWGVLPDAALVPTILTQWAFKSAYEILATPLTYWVIAAIKRKEGLDTYDRQVNFNPFALG
ncbi:MAG TPA: queuosine precursor transporter [Dongiaceae bacterium]|jgi:hypothetical protein|nr:queuosine precursor transporter [Dongiaceae bacterium]